MSTVISSLPKEIVVGVAIDIDSRKRLGVHFWWRTAIHLGGVEGIDVAPMTY